MYRCSAPENAKRRRTKREKGRMGLHRESTDRLYFDHGEHLEDANQGLRADCRAAQTATARSKPVVREFLLGRPSETTRRQSLCRSLDQLRTKARTARGFFRGPVESYTSVASSAQAHITARSESVGTSKSSKETVWCIAFMQTL